MRAPTMGTFGDGAYDAGTERADVGIGPLRSAFGYGASDAAVRHGRI